MSLSRLIKRNPVEVAIGGFAVVCVGFSIPGMVSQFQGMSTVRAEIQKQATEQQRLEAQQESLKERARIAEERYRNGCLPVQMRDKNTLISLAQGMPIIDTQTGNPIAPGTTVCDYNGNTAVMGWNGTQSVALDLAFTGNLGLVREALKRNGIQILPGDRGYTTSNRTNGQED